MATYAAGALPLGPSPLEFCFTSLSPSKSAPFAGTLSPKAPASANKLTRTIFKSNRTFSLPHKTLRPHKRPLSQVCAVGSYSDRSRWWQKGGEPNMQDVHSTQEFLDALSNAGEKLVVVEFFATWCGSCKALYPKLCQIAAEHPDIDFLKVSFEENKTMCKSLDVKALPFFHFYRGAAGRLDAFSCSLSKLAKLREAIAKHNSKDCSNGQPSALEEGTNILGLGPQLTAGSMV